MAAGQLKPRLREGQSAAQPSRRAVLGAAVVLPFVGMDQADGPLHPPSPSAAAGPHPRSGEEWEAALAAFEAAAAEVRAIEAATAGCGFEAEEALLPAHDSACAAMEGALTRMLRAPAPHLGAFAVKLELFFGHALEPHSVDADVAAAIRSDAGRLAGA